MATILQSRRASLPTGHFSVEEYHRWEGYDSNEPRTELIRGYILPRLPVSSPPHTFYVRRLTRWVQDAIGPGLLVRAECSLTLADSEPQPDLAVVEGEENDFFHVHPSTAKLAVEICITSRQRDRQKLELYAGANIPEYWIVFPEEKRIEVHAEPLADHYTRTQTYGAGETVACGTVPGFRVAIDEILRVRESRSREAR